MIDITCGLARACLPNVCWYHRKQHGKLPLWKRWEQTILPLGVQNLLQDTSKYICILRQNLYGCRWLRASAAMKFIVLRNYRLVTTYGDQDIGQHWLRWWPAAWRHQVLTWHDVDMTLLANTFHSQHDSWGFPACHTFYLGQWSHNYIA